MKAMTATLVFGLLMSAMVPAARAADFRFQDVPDSTYGPYVEARADSFTAAITGDGDSTDMWGHAGMVMVSIARLQVLVDDFKNDAEGVTDDIEAQLDSVDKLMNDVVDLDFDDFVPFLRSLTLHFEDPKYTQIGDMAEGTGNALETDVDSMIALVTALGEDAQQAFIDLEGHADALIAGSTFVSFSYQVNDDSATTLDTAIVNQADELMGVYGGVVAELEEGVGAVMGAADAPDSAVEKLRDAIGHLHGMLDSLAGMFAVELIDSMGLDSSFITDAHSYLDEADSVLLGREFEIGDSAEGKTVRPVAVLENLEAEWGDALAELFTSGAPDTITLFGLFPNGLPRDVLDALEPDMVIDTRADSAQVQAYFDSMETGYMAALTADAGDYDAHVGLAVIGFWNLVNAHKGEIDDIIGYLDEGDIVGLTNAHSVRSLDYTAETDAIKAHIEAALDTYEGVFTLVFREGPDPWPAPYVPAFTVSDGDDFVPSLLPPELLELGFDIVEGMVEARNAVADEFDGLFRNLREYVSFDLDPNHIDFSTVESDTDAVDMFIMANPDFLQITRKGHDEMLEAGSNIRAEFVRYANAAAALKDLLYAMAVREDDLDVDGGELRNVGDGIDSMVNVLKTDFDVPESTTFIDGERVNLSAWFDNPPDSLIYRIRAAVDADSMTDNTLGGLFPDRGVGSGKLVGFDVEQLLNRRRLNLIVKHLAPNPASADVAVKIQVNRQAPVSAVLADAAGAVARDFGASTAARGTYTVRYRVDGMPAGTYFLIVTVDGESFTRQLLLMP